METNGITCESGQEYNLLAYGEVYKSRMADALLKKGDYKVVLVSSAGDEVVKNITIASDYHFGTDEYTLYSEKTV